MSDDLDEFKEITDPMRIAEIVATGCRPLNAALQIGWSPGKLKRELKHDQEFRELIEAAEQEAVGKVEHAIMIRAMNGNVPAAMFVLLNRDPDRWRDVKRIEVHQDTSISVTVVRSAVEAAQELLRTNGAAALQGLRPAIEATASE